MEAGKLRHKFTIEKPTVTTDAAGRTSKTWSIVATRRGSLNSASVKYLNSAQSNIPLYTHVIGIRHLSALDNTCRFKLGSRVFDVVAVKDDPTIRGDQVITVTEVKHG